MDAQNLAKFEWENEIPFSIELVNKTLHAVIGDGEEVTSKDNVTGLLDKNPEGKKWGLNSVGRTHNDAFGTHGFGQVNTSFSIIVKKVEDGTTNMKITVSSRQGNFVGGGNLSYLQSECEKFINAISYYLEHQEFVNDWYEKVKPAALEYNEKRAANGGCMVFMPLFIAAGAYLTYLVF